MDSGCRHFYFCVKVFEANNDLHILTKPILPLKQNYLNSKIIICAIRGLKSSDECDIWAFPRSQLNRFLANFMHNMFGLPQPIFNGNSVVLHLFEGSVHTPLRWRRREEIKKLQIWTEFRTHDPSIIRHPMKPLPKYFLDPSRPKGWNCVAYRVQFMSEFELSL